MASLYRKKSPTGKALPSWYCFFRVPGDDGQLKQVHRSTGETTKKDAREAASLLEKTERKKAGADGEQSAAILAKISEAGELAMKGRLNPSKARTILAEIVRAGGGGDFLDYTVRQWTELWLKGKTGTTKPATLAFYTTGTKSFIAFLGERADAALDAITSREVTAFRDSLTDHGRTAKTANHYLKCLRSLFGDAVKEAALLHSPAAPVKTLHETDSTPRQPFTTEEVARLVASAPSSDWKGVILVGAFTGLRLVDAATLKAGNFDLDRGALKLTPRKTSRKGTTVEIPLHAELVAYLASNPPPPFPAAPLFTSLAKTTAGGRKGLSAQFRAIMKIAKISRNVTRKTEDGAARETASRSFHSLRHTFTSWLASESVPEELRRKMTGHTDSATHQKYTHHELSTLKGAVDKLPGLDGKKKTRKRKQALS